MVSFQCLFACFVSVLATSGIDYDVKIWAPFAEEPCYDRERADEVSCIMKLIVVSASEVVTESFLEHAFVGALLILIS